MLNPIFKFNDNIEIPDIFHFTCKHCGKSFEILDVKEKCPSCDTVLFEKMNKLSFKKLFKDCLFALGISEEKIDAFIIKKDIDFSDLKVCTEMSSMIDRNFEITFGGQYHSFIIRENFQQIMNYNFGKHERD